MWQDAAKTMLTTYSDEGFVSADYARELTAARTQAIEVERTSDDPPERIAEWLGSVSDRALHQLNLELTLDLMRIEEDAEAWESIGTLAAREIERCVLTSELGSAQQLADGIAGAATGDRPALHATAQRVQARLAGGAFSRHVVAQLRKAPEAEVAALSRLCQTVGPPLVRPLAETLANEDHVQAIRRLRELLIGFGAAGRQAVEHAEELDQPRRPPHGHRPVAGLRGQRGAARAGGDAERRRSPGAAGFDSRHRADRHQGSLRHAGTRLRIERGHSRHGGHASWCRCAIRRPSRRCATC